MYFMFPLYLHSWILKIKLNFFFQFKLGVLFKKGEGVSRDAQLAKSLFKLAANQGYNSLSSHHTANDSSNQDQDSAKLLTAFRNHMQAAASAASNQHQFV